MPGFELAVVLPYRNRADKRAIISEEITAHPDWPDRAIARVVGVTHPTVARIRHPERAAKPKSRPPTVASADGFYQLEAGVATRINGAFRVDDHGRFLLPAEPAPRAPRRQIRTVPREGWVTERSEVPPGR
jgi:hypothetical protein